MDAESPKMAPDVTKRTIPSDVLDEIRRLELEILREQPSDCWNVGEAWPASTAGNQE